METINLSDSKETPIPLNIYSSENHKTDEVLVIVGGSGDTRKSLKPLANKLRQLNYTNNILF